MHLNRLRISGFKSFPERADLAFDTGVTAIVGPNGCGKSNVIDAITWVLGEQSARSLRGERMEDVIFGGSDARRPTATAEVRLQLSQVTAALAMLGGQDAPAVHVPGNGSNGAGTNGHRAGETPAHPPGAGPQDPQAVLDETPCIARDVEVGRRLFRSGESEYLIDGHACRLRDIQDLLMDSGVGVKAYAVIEQGAIGQILSARPLERRRLIEEAAGVTRYKSRRRAAELKLEAAQQNLTRVDDIVYEVDRQRGALKRQAAKARRYGRLREELRRWEKVSYARKADALAQAIDVARQGLDSARAREAGAAARVAALEAAHEQQRIELAAADRAATTARDAAHVHELAAGRLQQRIEFDRQRVQSLTEASARGAAELEALAAKREPLQAELAKQSAGWRQCDADRKAAAGKREAAETAHEAAQTALAGLDADVEAARNEVFATLNAATVLQHVLKSVPEAIERVDADIARLEAEAADVATEAAQLDARRAAAAADEARAEAALKTTRAARAERDAEQSAARIEREARVAAARERERELASLSARSASLEELVAAREGYNDAARLLLNQPSDALEQLGSVADHLTVNRKHERVVEGGLGELLQCVVVRSERDARAGMKLAAASGAGRCGFLVAGADAGAEPASIPTPPTPALTSFTALARVSGPAAAAVRRLLARCWLAPSFKAASVAAGATDDAVVTPDGVVFRGSALVHGGGWSATRGILRIEGELEELRGRLATEQAEVRRLGAEVAELDAAVARGQTELETLQVDEHALEKELLEARLGLSRCGEEAARLQQRQDVVRTECRKARDERDALEKKQAEARDAIAKLEIDQRAAEERCTAAQRRLFDAREAVETLSREANQARVAHAELAERAAGLEADVRRLQEAAGELERRASACAADRQRAADEQRDLQAEIARTEQQLDTETGQLDTQREEVRAMDASAAELRERIAAQGREVQAAREALDTLHAEIGRIEVDQAKAEAEHDTLSAACRDGLQASLDQVRAEVAEWERDGLVAAPALPGEPALDDDSDEPPEPGADGTGAGDVREGREALTPEDVVGALRARIERLGAVNLMAIEQFDELEQRYDFLTAQRKDLLDSIQSTGAAIERIDVTTRERFKEAFTAVNEHLQTTFSTLFGGGRAGLVLLDEADVLESGIDIVAQPPGKRLQSIQLLSGGEKALTAMALMFAIFKYRPSPFCLLDEIDAPLDEANVSRFVDMLRGMEDCTQFVVVTHNRKTMEIADRLYGVTMEEPGVSKLISVNLH